MNVQDDSGLTVMGEALEQTGFDQDWNELEGSEIIAADKDFSVLWPKSGAYVAHCLTCSGDSSTATFESPEQEDRDQWVDVHITDTGHTVIMSNFQRGEEDGPDNSG